MVDELQVVFEREIAFRTVKTGAAAAFANSGAGGDEDGFANGGGDFEAGAAGKGFMQSGGVAGAVGRVVLSPLEFGIVASFRVGFFAGFALAG